MSELTVNQQYGRTIYIGIAFMIMFTSFNSLQNIISKLYEQYHYDNLGQTAIFFLYFSFGVANLFSSYIIKVSGYKKALFLSSLGYGIFEATGIPIAAGVEMPHILPWFFVVLGAVICGISASILWVAQAAYTSQVASVDRKSELFGLFWALMMSSQITGNLLTTFILGKMSNLVYFILLTCLGFLSSLFFMFLPSAGRPSNENRDQEAEQQTVLKQELSKVWNLIRDRKNIYLILYLWFPGLTVSFYAGFLYKLVKDNLGQQPDESEDDYTHRVHFAQGLVFIALGGSQLLTGLLMNRFSEKYNKYSLAVVGTLIVEVAGVVSLVCFFTKSYVLCFFCAFLWGSSETFLQTNTNALIGILFPNQIEAYSAYRLLFAIGVSMTLLLGIVLSNAPNYIFLSIVLVLQVFVTFISLHLRRETVDEGTLLQSGNE